MMRGMGEGKLGREMKRRRMKRRRRRRMGRSKSKFEVLEYKSEP